MAQGTTHDDEEERSEEGWAAVQECRPVRTMAHSVDGCAAVHIEGVQTLATHSTSSLECSLPSSDGSDHVCEEIAIAPTTTSKDTCASSP